MYILIKTNPLTEEHQRVFEDKLFSLMNDGFIDEFIESTNGAADLSWFDFFAAKDRLGMMFPDMEEHKLIDLTREFMRDCHEDVGLHSLLGAMIDTQLENFLKERNEE